MLNWGSPIALWLGLSSLAVIFFYFLRMRFRRHPVSSIYLWSKFQRLSQSGNKLHRRSVWLLLLQVIAVMAAVFALAQPFWTSQTSTQAGMIFLVDVSASMSAKDGRQAPAGGRARLEEAKELVKEKILRLPPQTEGMIFLCASDIKPLGTPTTDHKELCNRLNQASVYGAGFNETEVVAELQSWLTIHQGIWKACLVTDGGLDMGGKKLNALFSNSLQSITVGSSGNNLGVTALRLLPGEAQFLVNNGWPEERLIQVSLHRDNHFITKRRIKVPAGISSQSLPFSEVIRTSFYLIRIEQKPDNFSLDDQYYFALNQARPIRVLLAGKDNPFLRAILSLPGVHLTETLQLPSDFNGEGWDLVITDRTVIPGGLRCNWLSFGTIPVDAPVRYGAPASGILTSYENSRNHPLLRFVDWQSVQANTSHSLMAFSNVQILATVEGKPVLAAWDKDGSHRVICSFDLYHSNLGLSGAFPVFMQNLLQWCVPQFNNPLAYTLTVGEKVTLAEPPTWQIMDSNSAAKAFRKGAQLTVQAGRPGIFAWGQGVTRGVLVANLPAEESDIAPQPLHFEKMAQQTAVVNTYQRISFIRWLLMLVLFCLFLEWLLWRGVPAGKE